MITKITGEQPFQILATNFSISPSEQDYTLQISADGSNFSDLFTVSAGQTKMVTNVANGSYYRLKNNESDVEINWRTQCNDGQGGGGGGQGPQGPAGPQGPQGPAGGGGDSGQVQTQIDESISAFSQELQEGQPIVGMAAQLYSPDGVTSNGHFAYRTTAGDADVASGDAELRKLEGNSDYSDVVTTYNEEVVLYRNDEPVEGFTCDILSSITVYEWVEVNNSNIASQNAQVVRNKLNNTTGYPGWFYTGGGDMQWQWNGSTLSPQRSTVVDLGDGWWRPTTDDGARAYFDGEWLTIYLTGVGQNVYVTTFQDGFIPVEAEMGIGTEVPNDIPFGESTYTYVLDWDPELPQALTNMQISGEPYAGGTGDVIVINKSMSVSGNAKYPQPGSFVALGLNSFDYTCEGILTTIVEEGKKYSYDSNDGEFRVDTDSNYNTYAIYAVTGLDNGYVIHMDGGSFNNKTAGVADSNDALEIDNADFDTTIENGNLIVYPTTAMPYIILSVPTEDVDKVCVHPRWSGKEDNGFEEYNESVVDLSNLAQYPLYSVGDYRNVIDLKNGAFNEYVTTEPFDADTLNDYLENGYTLGTDINYDENYIYIASDEPTTTSISADYTYKDNDFSVEYFVENGEIMPVPVYAETYYITNLVDKLRRMENAFIHLDSPNNEGEVGKTYEYQGRLMNWVEGSGATAEWTKTISAAGTDEGVGFIYGIIPDGTVIFEFKYQYSGDWRKVVYSGNTLYLTETAGTVVCAVTVNNTFQFNTQVYTSYNIKGEFKNGHIGFRKTNLILFQNVYNGITQNGHYELLDKYNYPYVVEGYGMPKWNSNGQVVQKQYDVYEKAIKLNTSGISTNFLTRNTNGPSSLFAPTLGGAEGQMLISGGNNAEPTWIDWIKVVKITSADYESLTVKDPNTLYAIDDNA